MGFSPPPILSLPLVSLPLLFLLTLPLTPLPLPAAAPAPASTSTPEIPIHLPDPVFNLDPDARPLRTLDENAARYVDLFLPVRTDNAALSPDGKLIAYTVRDNEKEELFLMIVNAANPSQGITKKRIATDDDTTDYSGEDVREKTPARVRWMGWVTPNRLVLETNLNFASVGFEGGSRSIAGALIAVDGDGQNAAVIATPYDLDKVGFDSPGSRAIRPPAGTASSRADAITDNFLQVSDPQSLEIDMPSLADASSSSRNPRRPFVLDYIPDTPGSILVRAGGGGSYGVFSIDALAGKRKNLSEQEPGAYTHTLSDHAGVARIILPAATYDKFPHRYAANVTRGLSRWTDLDKLIKPTPTAPTPTGAAAPTANHKPETVNPGGVPAASFWVSPDNFFGRRSIPLGFDHDPDILYYASNTERDTYGIYALNMKTGERTNFTLESPIYDLITPRTDGFPAGPTGSGILVFDRYTRKLAGVHIEGTVRTTQWLIPELNAAQKTLEHSLPGRIVKVLEWNEQRTRFLVFASAPNDPGAYYIYDRAEKKLNEFVRSSPWIDTEMLHESTDFSFPASDGIQVTGIITMPSNIRVKKLPVVVVCPAFPWQRVQLDFRPMTQALANMGFAVIEINSRAAWGYGFKRRQSALAYERSAAQADDIILALDALAAYVPIDPRHVALLGEKYGGYTALRALQLRPDRFRCAVAIDSPVNPGEWLNDLGANLGSVSLLLTRSGYDSPEELRAAPLVKSASSLKKPVCIFNYPGNLESEDPTNSRMLIAGRELVDATKRNGASESIFHELTEDYMRDLPRAKSLVYQEVEAFLNSAMYSFRVDMGPMRVVDPKDAPKPALP